MHAMAPGSKGELHAGQAEGGATAGGGATGTAGRAPDCFGGGGGAGAGPTAAATGSRAGAPITNCVWHCGHLTCLPVELSGTCMRS